MGILSYDSNYKAEFEDRVLAHLQLVIGAKLRRGESFHFSWTTDANAGSGRTTIWLHPTVPLIYSYFGNRMPAINKLWIDALMAAANSPAGLQIVPEPTGAAETAVAGAK